MESGTELKIPELYTLKERKVKLNLEIRPGEGGEDAKLLVQDQAAIYIKYATSVGIKVDVTNEDHG